MGHQVLISDSFSGIYEHQILRYYGDFCCGISRGIHHIVWRFLIKFFTT